VRDVTPPSALASGAFVMRRRRLVAQALGEGLRRCMSVDGCMTAQTILYQCLVAVVMASGPGSDAGAAQAQQLQIEVLAAYDAGGFPVGRVATPGEPLYEQHGLEVAAAQVALNGDHLR
jgi:hypothetical protein